jgi:hypothetical protein
MSAPGGPDPDLIVTLEDSMSEITSLFLVVEEGTASSRSELHEAR